jgi:hypothetical protein
MCAPPRGIYALMVTTPPADRNPLHRRACLHGCMLPLPRRPSRWLRSLSTLVSNTSSDPRWPGWQVVIGIEVHAQVKSREKLFSGERCILGYTAGSVSDPTPEDSWTNDPPQPPSTRVSAFDASFPGTLPVRLPDMFPVCAPFNFPLPEAQSNLCCSRGSNCVGTELKRSTPFYLRQEALLLPGPASRIPNHSTLWYSSCHVLTLISPLSFG